MQEMVIYGVSFDMVGKQPIVLLKTVDGNKFLPIWIGHPEAASILMKLQGAGTPRPMTHDLLCDILGELDVKCTQVSVTELRENTFFASITLSVAGRELEIDSRPSDAIALAVRSGAPIYAAEEVISESAIEFEHDVEESEDVVEKFKEFLDQVSPEDFAAGDSSSGAYAGAGRRPSVARVLQHTSLPHSLASLAYAPLRLAASGRPTSRVLGRLASAPLNSLLQLHWPAWPTRRSDAWRASRARRRTSQPAAGALSRVNALSSISPTSSSNEIPVASAACGSRLVSVIPGTTFASSTHSSDVSWSTIRSMRAKPWQPSSSYTSTASSCARCVISVGSSAGQTNVVMPIP